MTTIEEIKDIENPEISQTSTSLVSSNVNEEKIAPNFDWSKIPSTAVDTKRDEIKVGDYLVIERGDFRKLHKFRKPDDVLALGKMSVQLNTIVGKRFDSYFKLIFIKKNTYSLEKVKKPKSITDLIKVNEHGKDNRNIIDDGHSQKMPTTEIIKLREGPSSSTEILEKLITNSTTFSSKTEFSQAKYLKKKENKYCEYIKIRKPSIPLITEIYYQINDPRSIALRRDDLAQILFYSAVCCYGNHLVYESGTSGLLVAAILSRMGVKTEAQLVHVHPGNEPQRQAVLAMNFPEELLSRYINVNLYSIIRCYYQQYIPFLNFKDGTLITANQAKRIKLDTENQETPKIPIIDNKMDLDASEEFKPENIEVIAENLIEEMEVAENRVIIRKQAESSSFKEPEVLQRNNKSENQKRSKKNQKSKSQTAEKCCESRIKRNIETQGLDLTKLKQWQVDNLKACELFEQKMDSLIIVANEDPFQIYEAFRPFVNPNRAVVVYSESVEILSDLYLQLKQRGDIIAVQITETFMRSWQVLPKRTHPLVKMDHGGYILRGITVSNDENNIKVY